MPGELHETFRQSQYGLATRGATCSAFCLLLAASFPALPGSLQMSPVRAELTAAHPVEAIRVMNHGAEPSVVQLEPMAWSQRDGKDVYEPTRDIIATPRYSRCSPAPRRWCASACAARLIPRES
jgi:fimbrial chaperone protein